MRSHTVLRLPNGIFYAGVKTNVLFCTRRGGNPENSRSIWVYDARTNVPSFGKRTPQTREFFRSFERCFGEDPEGRDRAKFPLDRDDRWRKFNRDELQQDGDNLDVKWLREESRPDDSVAEAEEIAAEIMSSLNLALDEVRSLSEMIGSSQRDPL
jgi:type I restriction enzyme M protein